MSTTIINDGDADLVTRDRLFSCDYCGALFTGESADYDLVTDPVLRGKLGIEASATCPTCSNTAYSYRGNEIPYPVSLKNTNASLKTTYIAGEGFATDTLVAEVYYADGSHKTITSEEYTVSPARDLIIGDDTVTISYTELGKTVTLEIPVTVNAIKLAKPYIDGATTFTYDGEEQAPNIVGYDEDTMTQSGTDAATNAGEYTSTYSITDTDVYVWADGTNTDVTLSWEIVAAVVTAPTFVGESELVYNGTVQGPEVEGYDEDLMTKTGDETATDAGAYQVTFILIDTTNYVWSVGGTEDITLIWDIYPASVAVPTVDGPIEYTGSEISLVDHLTGYDADLMTLSGDTVGLDAVEYHATASLIDAVNYLWNGVTAEDQDIMWFIVEPEV